MFKYLTVVTLALSLLLACSNNRAFASTNISQQANGWAFFGAQMGLSLGLGAATGVSLWGCKHMQNVGCPLTALSTVAIGGGGGAYLGYRAFGGGATQGDWSEPIGWGLATVLPAMITGANLFYGITGAIYPEVSTGKAWGAAAGGAVLMGAAGYWAASILPSHRDGYMAPVLGIGTILPLASVVAFLVDAVSTKTERSTAGLIIPPALATAFASYLVYALYNR